MMLSRVAENLFWIGRNVERAQNVCRLLDATYQMQLGTVINRSLERADGPRLRLVLQILGLDLGVLKQNGRLLNELKQMTFGQSGDHTIRTLLSQAKENTRATQDVLGSEPFSQLNRLSHLLDGKRIRVRFHESPSRVLNQISQRCLLFFALAEDGQSRAAPWHFLNLGRRLESVGILSRVLYEGIVKTENLIREPGFAHWAWVLNTCAARDSFMSRHPEGVTTMNLVDQLLLNPSFPHSVRYGVLESKKSIESIIAEVGNDRGSHAERMIGKLDSMLRYTDATEVMGIGLESILSEIQITCDRVCDRLYAAYF